MLAKGRSVIDRDLRLAQNIVFTRNMFHSNLLWQKTYVKKLPLQHLTIILYTLRDTKKIKKKRETHKKSVLFNKKKDLVNFFLQA